MTTERRSAREASRVGDVDAAAVHRDLKTVEHLEGGLLRIDLREPRRELATSLRELLRARRLALSDPEIMGGDPVFRGTRVPVHMIASLLTQGSTPTELIEAHGRDGPAGACLCRGLSLARPAARPSALARPQAGAPVAAPARRPYGVVRRRMPPRSTWLPSSGKPGMKPGTSRMSAAPAGGTGTSSATPATGTLSSSPTMPAISASSF